MCVSALFLYSFFCFLTSSLYVKSMFICQLNVLLYLAFSLSCLPRESLLLLLLSPSPSSLSMLLLLLYYGIAYSPNICFRTYIYEHIHRKSENGRERKTHSLTQAHCVLLYSCRICVIEFPTLIWQQKRGKTQLPLSLFLPLLRAVS